VELRNQLLAASIRTAALERGLAAVEVESYEDAADIVESRLGALAGAQAVSDPDAVRQLRRDENLMVLDQITRYLASNEAPPDRDALSYAFGCECRQPGCAERAELEVSDYERLVRAGGFVSAH
jgi:hypothetical protein